MTLRAHDIDPGEFQGGTEKELVYEHVRVQVDARAKTLHIYPK